MFLRAMEEDRAIHDKDRQDGGDRNEESGTLPRGSAGRRRRKREARRIDERLDLHGLNVEQALRRLESFVVRASASRKRRLLIITGRGHGSEGGVPRVRLAVSRWLDRELRSGRTRLRAYREAPPELGGDGAFVVELS